MHEPLWSAARAVVVLHAFRIVQAARAIPVAIGERGDQLAIEGVGLVAARRVVDRQRQGAVRRDDGQGIVVSYYSFLILLSKRLDTASPMG